MKFFIILGLLGSASAFAQTSVSQDRVNCITALNDADQVLISTVDRLTNEAVAIKEKKLGRKLTSAEINQIGDFGVNALNARPNTMRHFCYDLYNL